MVQDLAALLRVVFFFKHNKIDDTENADSLLKAEASGKSELPL